MSNSLDVFDAFSRAYAREKFETMSLRDYLLAARDNPMMYASPAERMIAAMRKPRPEVWPYPMARWAFSFATLFPGLTDRAVRRRWMRQRPCG